MKLSSAQMDAFHRDGYLIVPDVFTAKEMDAALAACDQITYGSSFEEWKVAATKGEKSAVADGISAKAANGRAQFPTGSDALDRLIRNDDYLDCFEQLFGTTHLHYCNAHLFVRSGPNDKRHADEVWQGYHIDHDTNTFLPPWTGCGAFDYINSGVYLHDVLDDGAPMQILPGSHKDLVQNLTQWTREGIASARGAFDDIRKIPSFAKPLNCTGKKGSALFYSSYTVHAAIGFKNKNVQRAFWTMSIARGDAQSFTRYSVPYHYGERDFFVPFWKNSSPRVRSLFGWPPVGHPYYTAQTIELLEKSFPGMDMSAYKERVGV
jgi:ectoine hydroxylase-related dioxygenase (phytanoyl-CoA dioxygenase family)